MFEVALDFVNGCFEFGGAILCWFNVKRILKDKKIEGVYWPVQAFFSTWGFWNIFYYSGLNQWVSFYGGIMLFLGNGTWTVLAAYYDRKNKNETITMPIM
jgi:hypothetical protein